jgi:MFS family permease
MASRRAESIWSRTFAFLCLAQFLGYAQHSLLTPTFPLYVTELGGSPFMVGLVLGSFAVTSVLVRPVIGHWADRWNESGVMISGLLFLGASILLCFAPFVETTMLANGLRGIGWAGLNTGGYTLLALTAPEARRGEASGYYSGLQGSAAMFFPAIALWLIYAPFGGFKVVFAVAVALAWIGAGVSAMMPRNVPRAVRSAQTDDASSWWRELFGFLDRDVFLPSAMLFCLNLSLPAVTSFIVLYARQIGIEHFGAYFVVSGATNLLARPLLGRASDKIGRSRSLIAGFALQSAALLLLVTVSELFGVIICGTLYMLGNAIGSSTTLALAVERANPLRRGKAMATFSVAYPLAYGVGSLLTGSVVEIAGYIGMFLFAAALEAVGLIITLTNSSRLKS